MITGNYPSLRLRRSRKNDWSRRLIQENSLSSSDFVLPVFLIDGKNTKQSIKTMPNVYRYTIDKIGIVIDRAIKNKIPMVALFPYTETKKKNPLGTEALNENNLVCKAIRFIKKKYKNKIGIMCDVALDPYTSHGHDGLMNIEGEIIKCFSKLVTICYHVYSKSVEEFINTVENTNIDFCCDLDDEEEEEEVGGGDEEEGGEEEEVDVDEEVDGDEEEEVVASDDK